MWKRQIKSLLLVDMDNVNAGRFTSAIGSWTAWIEDGAFSERRHKRKLLEKRVYWNGATDKPYELFKAHGYQPFPCRSEALNKLRANKSSADIVIAIDAIDLAHKLRGLEEVILLTADTDFVPLVNRLQEMKLSVVTCGKVGDPSAAIFRKWADEVIADVSLQAAYDYHRPAKRAAKRPPLSPPQAPPTPPAAPVAAAPTASSAPAAPARKATPSKRKRAKQQQQFDLQPAAKAVLEVAMQTPNRPLSRPVIERALSTVRGFTKTPTKQYAAYFGHTNFETLLRQLAMVEPQLDYARDQSGRWQMRFVGDLPLQAEQNGGSAAGAGVDA